MPNKETPKAPESAPSKKSARLTSQLAQSQIEVLIPDEILSEKQLQSFLLAEVLDYLYWVVHERQHLDPERTAIVLRLLTEISYITERSVATARPRLAESLLLLKLLFPKGSIGRSGW